MAILVDQLDADIIHVNAAMDARLQVGLGDMQRCRRGEEGAHLIGHHGVGRALAQHPHGRIGQDAEALAALRFPIRPGEAIFAHAEEGKIVVGQPVEKLHRLGDLVGGEQRRALPIAAGNRAQPGPHFGPVPHGKADIGVDAFKFGAQRLPRRRIQPASNVDMDQAFALEIAGWGRPGHPGQPGQPARSVPLHRNHRMGHQADVEPALGQFGKGGGKQERHVVVHHLDDGEPLALCRAAVDDADVGDAGRPALEALERICGKSGQNPGRNRRQVLARHPPEQH
jgi:hypothetical protein